MDIDKLVTIRMRCIEAGTVKQPPADAPKSEPGK
jgi:hypothetical protein